MSKIDEMIRMLCPDLPAGRQVGWKPWFAYVVLCDDGSLYKGHTIDIARRYEDHCSGIGAEHTKKHKPVRIVLLEGLDSLDEAVKREKYYKSGCGREWLKENVRENSTICLNLMK